MLYAFKCNWSNQIVIDMVLPCIYCIIGCSRNKYNLCCESLPLNQKYRHSELTNFIIQTKGQRKDTKNNIFLKKLSKKFVEKLMYFCIMYTKKEASSFILLLLQIFNKELCPVILFHLRIPSCSKFRPRIIEHILSVKGIYRNSVPFFIIVSIAFNF